jgi:hypothetical protein
MKLLERQRAKERAVEPCADCQTTGCTDEWDASLDALLAFVGGPAADSGKVNRARQPKKKAKNGKKRPKRSRSPQYVFLLSSFFFLLSFHSTYQLPCIRRVVSIPVHANLEWSTSSHRVCSD